MTDNNQKGPGKKRWIVLGLVILIFVFSSFLKPITPAILVPGEPLTPPLFYVAGQPFTITNTLLTTFLIDLLLILVIIFVRRTMGDENTPSRGLANVFEAIVEGIYNLSESTAGSRWAKSFFPWVATIIILVLFANLTRLLPGFETVGFLAEAHGEHGYPAKTITSNISYIYQPSGDAAQVEGEEHGQLYEVIPFLRGPSTDLNFTIALALTTVIMVQVFGVRAGGLGYFTKFFNFGPFIKMWRLKEVDAFSILMPFIDIFVGILELISEFAKIVSFSFRLFGAIFGGSVLVAILVTLLPAVIFLLYFLELFLGTIQALVFGILALVFMTMAIQAHGHSGEEHGEAH